MDTTYIKKFEPLWGEWYVVRKLGTGSYGCVWEVANETTGEHAAVKEILVPNSLKTLRDAKLEGMDPTSAKDYFYRVVERTQRESELMYRLRDCHHIVRYDEDCIYDLSEYQDFGWGLYIRMELLLPLERVLLDRELHLRDVLKLGLDLCDALITCAEQAIVHQDIKPDNIFYDEVTGSYKLGDFGIAQETGRETAKKGRPGTLSYMSPEVFQHGAVTFDLDHYALGMLLYRLLNQFRMPFLPAYPEPFTPEERNSALMKRLGGAEIPPPHIHIFEEGEEAFAVKIEKSEAALADRLGKIVQKSISADIRDRYASIEEFRAELKACGEL